MCHLIVKSDQKKIIWLTNEKSLQALSECGKMEAVEIEKELAYEIS